MTEKLHAHEYNEDIQAPKKPEQNRIPAELKEKIRFKQNLEIKVAQLEALQTEYNAPKREEISHEEHQYEQEMILEKIIKTQKQVSRLQKKLNRKARKPETEEYMMQDADGLTIRIEETQSITVELGQEMNMRVDRLTLKSVKIQSDITEKQAAKLQAILSKIEQTKDLKTRASLVQQQMILAEEIKESEIVPLEDLEALNLSEEDQALRESLLKKREKFHREIAQIRKLDGIVTEMNVMFSAKGIDMQPEAPGFFLGTPIGPKQAEHPESAVQSFSFVGKNGRPVQFGVALETIRVNGHVIEAGDYFIQTTDENNNTTLKKYSSQSAMEKALSAHMPIPEGQQLSFLPNLDGKKVSMIASAATKSLGAGLAAGALYKTAQYLRSGASEVELSEGDKNMEDSLLKYELSHSEDPAMWIENASEEQLERIEDVTFEQETLRELPDLSTMPNLKTVTVSGGSLEKLNGETLPASVQKLDLSNNQIKDLSGLDKYQNLTDLDLSGNNLQAMDLMTKGGKNVLQSLKHLRNLNLSNNIFRTFPDSGMDELNKLRTIDISGNLLTSIPEELSHLQWLEEFDASSNRIKEIPDWMGKFKRLRHLDMAGNPLNYITPELMNIDRLWYLDITDHVAYDTPPELFEALESKLRFCYTEKRKESNPTGPTGKMADQDYTL